MKKILGTILALGLIFRLLFLGKRQLWTDELIQAVAVQASSAEEMLRRLSAGVSLASPLDSLVQRAVVSVLGQSDWSLRLHAALFGVLAIFFFYRVSQHLFGERVALYSSALFAIYPLNLHYSQEAGPWSMLLVLALAAYDLLLRQISGNPAPGRWLLLLLVLTLLLYTAVEGAAIIAGQALGLLFTARHRKPARSAEDRDLPAARGRRALAYLAVALTAVLAFLPWALSVPSRFGDSFAQLRDPRLVAEILKGIGDNSYAVTALLLAGVATGIRALRVHGRTRILVWMVLWFLSLGAVLILEAALGRPLGARHILHVVPPLLLLAGYGLSHVGERLTILDRFPHTLSSPAQLYGAVLLLASAWITFGHWYKEPVDWAGTARYLEETAQPGDALSMPGVFVLIEYHSPRLAAYRSDDLDPGPGTLARPDVERRRVVCFSGMKEDPCRTFRPYATKDKAWTRRDFAGLTVFERH